MFRFSPILQVRPTEAAAIFTAIRRSGRGMIHSREEGKRRRGGGGKSNGFFGVAFERGMEGDVSGADIEEK